MSVGHFLLLPRTVVDIVAANVAFRTTGHQNKAGHLYRPTVAMTTNLYQSIRDYLGAEKVKEEEGKFLELIAISVSNVPVNGLDQYWCKHMR